MSFQRKPLRNRAQVNKLVSPTLQRTTTEDTQTAINRIVCEALQRGKSQGYPTAGTEDLKAEVLARVDLVLQAKADEAIGLLSHAQRLKLIESVATLSVSDAQDARDQLKRCVSLEAEASLATSRVIPSFFWKRLLCTNLLSIPDVLSIGASCRALRADHAFGLHTFVVPSLLRGSGESGVLLSSTTPASCPSHEGLVRLAFKHRYASAVVACSRGARFSVSDFELLPLKLLTVLDLGFCHNIPETVLIGALQRSCNLSDLSLRGCVQLTSDGFDQIVAGSAYNHLDLCGCDNLDADRALQAIESHLPNLDSLRFGYIASSKLWTVEDIPIRRMSASMCQQFSASMKKLRLLELDLGLCDKIGDAGVLALLGCRSLSSLLLWNVCNLEQTSLKKIVEHFAHHITMLGVHDCYHRHDSYLHVVPSSWGLATKRDVNLYFDTGATKVADAQHGTGKRHVGLSLLVATNVARDPAHVLAPVLESVVEHCSPTEISLDTDDDQVFNPLLALSDKGQIESVSFFDNTNLDGSFSFLQKLIEKCPLLEHFGAEIRGRSSYRLIEDACFESILCQLAKSCPRLSSFEWNLESGSGGSGGVNVANYSGDTGVCGTRRCSLAVLETFLMDCPCLSTVHLPSPSIDSWVCFWEILKKTETSMPTLALVQKASTSTTTSRTILDSIQTVVAERADSITEFVAHGVTVPPDCLAFLAERGRLESVTLVFGENGPTAELLNVLAESCIGSLRKLAIIGSHDSTACARALRRCAQFGLEELDLRDSIVDNQTILEVTELARRSLLRLYLPSTDFTTVFAVAGACRHLEVLQITADKGDKALVGKDESAKAFGNTEEAVILKLVALCPGLRHLEWDGMHVDGEETDTTRRAILRQAPALNHCACWNMDFYRGLQYNDGYQEDQGSDQDA